jgi:hypothetical protein
MALQYSVLVRDNKNDSIETTIGTAPTLLILTGTAPANCAAADTGTVLATVTLPSDWMAASSGGVKAKAAGAWTDATADASGTAGYFRIKQGATCHIQGTVGTSSADMIVDSVSFTAGQSFTVNTFSITSGNA